MPTRIISVSIPAFSNSAKTVFIEPAVFPFSLALPLNPTTFNFVLLVTFFKIKSLESKAMPLGIFLKFFHFVFIVKIQKDNTIVRDDPAVVALLF